MSEKQQWMALMREFGKRSTTPGDIDEAMNELQSDQQIVVGLHYKKRLPMDVVVAVMLAARGWNERETRTTFARATVALRTALSIKHRRHP